MRILRAADRIPTPWKNGGGLTCEVAAWPPGASLPHFEWRASIAEVTSDGPFSDFEGVDRVITVLEGAGLELRFEGHKAVRVDTSAVPLAFPGDVPGIWMDIRQLHLALLRRRAGHGQMNAIGSARFEMIVLDPQSA